MVIKVVAEIKGRFLHISFKYGVDNLTCFPFKSREMNITVRQKVIEKSRYVQVIRDRQLNSFLDSSEHVSVVGPDEVVPLGLCDFIEAFLDAGPQVLKGHLGDLLLKGKDPNITACVDLHDTSNTGIVRQLVVGHLPPEALYRAVPGAARGEEERSKATLVHLPEASGRMVTGMTEQDEGLLRNLESLLIEDEPNRASGSRLDALVEQGQILK
jgi:hypothetical protein